MKSPNINIYFLFVVVLSCIFITGCATSDQDGPSMPKPLVFNEDEMSGSLGIDANKVWVENKKEVVKIGESVQKRPINAHILGNGEKTVMLVGGLHGDEPGGETLLTSIVSLYSEYPQLFIGYKVVVIPALNPDGLENKTRHNANKVDLNQDLPDNCWGKTGWKSRALTRSFKDVQPETVALLNALKMYPPEWIISVQSPVGCIDFNGPGAIKMAYKMSKVCNLPVKKLKTKAGSLGALAEKDLEIPCVTVELEYNHSRGSMNSKEKMLYSGAILELLKSD